MNRIVMAFVFSLSFPAWAQGSAPSSLSLGKYIEQVKLQNPGARAAIDSVEAAKLRENFADKEITPELYVEYGIYDNRQEPVNPFSPQETQGRSWKTGVRKQTLWGLSADAYLTSARTNLLGVNPSFIPNADYEQSAFGLKLNQALWRNSFGASTRANRQAVQAADRMALLQAQFKLKNILLQAENTYWSLVSYNEIIKLQSENVERARRLRDHMKQRASMRLYDDVDAMQTEASFQMREIDLQSSNNERNALIRMFNTLRGVNSDTVEALEELPKEEFLLKTVKDPTKRMSREDFRGLYEQAKQMEGLATASASDLYPKLDLVAGISGNGFDPSTGTATSEALQGQHPNWNVGVVFSVPLDYGLIHNSRSSFKAQARAARTMLEQARFEEDRTWDDLLKKNREAQTTFEKTISLEKLQTELVKLERQRLLNGRSTTLQTLTIEQNLAASQISRVRAQLALLQVHNVLKQFEELP